MKTKLNTSTTMMCYKQIKLLSTTVNIWSKRAIKKCWRDNDVDDKNGIRKTRTRMRLIEYTYLESEQNAETRKEKIYSCHLRSVGKAYCHHLVHYSRGTEKVSR